MQAESLFSEKSVIYTPTKVAQLAQSCFDERFGAIRVEGEISGASRSPLGHVYFQLKDQKSNLKAVIWRSNAAKFDSLIRNGLTVLAHGALAVYGPRSEYQLIVRRVEPRGEGALRLAYERLRARLHAEGLFSEFRKRPLPSWPRRVALITSPKGAAVEDFLKTALGRFPQAGVSLYPTRTQGEGAAAEMVAAIEAINGWGGFDLIVLTRGGGSLEDLWAYNEEALVRAVAASRVPVLAAIGHSTDLSLTEMAADHKAITPTAAAEKVFPNAREILAGLTLSRERLERAITQRLRREGDKLANLRAALPALLERRLLAAGAQWDQLLEALGRSVRLFLAQKRHALDHAAARLALLSPRAQLARQRLAREALAERLERAFRERLRREGEILRSLRAQLPARLELRLLAASVQVGQAREGLARSLKLFLVTIRASLKAPVEKLAVLSPAKRLAERRDELSGLRERLRALGGRLLERRRLELSHAMERLRIISPLGVLTRGYGVATDMSGKVIKSSQDIAVGDPFRLRLGKGVLSAVVTAAEGPPKRKKKRND
ncbi:MAG: exodeoxyribonuclease VII large subunit [Deltaproteobacteria bacterium]|jgi:exodeoxyribonuclease VII large subunit|nr:exodeoxyribonuclease VII large subunit [Deltaproteobacteria bacterium]